METDRRYVLLDRHGAIPALRWGGRARNRADWSANVKIVRVGAGLRFLGLQRATGLVMRPLMCLELRVQ